MGLLDDAIREHLELKRLRGADPGEVAREQREALDAVPDGVQAEAPAGEPNFEEPFAGPIAVDADPEQPSQAKPHSPARPITGGEPVRAPAPAPEQSPDVIQETAELDMRAVLNGETDSSTGSSPAPEAVAVRDRAQETEKDQSESSMEWEVPGDAPEGTPQHESRRQRRRRERQE
jgi:hypothetical protein